MLLGVSLFYKIFFSSNVDHVFLYPLIAGAIIFRKRVKNLFFSGILIEKNFKLKTNRRAQCSKGSRNVVVEFLNLKTLIECQK